MNAGRELDVLIAEKVMELKTEPIEIASGESDIRIVGQSAGGLGLWYKSVPRYSTRIEDAWQVVEKMNEFYDNDVFIENWRGGSWCCFMVPMAASAWPEERRPGACAETAPLAICLTALKAVGYEVPS